MATASANMHSIDDRTYRKRIRAWTIYDWANSAFVTTITAAVLPAYYSAVAGATLPSAATATAYWSITASIALFIVALLSPILGTISDVMRGKKLFLSIFIGVGIVGAGLLVLISTGDWLLASLFYIIGRVGFAGANVFYDSLLPHVAKEEDRDRVSTSGFAWGYIGGGILLAINVVMLSVIPDSWFEFAGIRLSFLSVAIWWAVFSIPILRDVPEPRSAEEELTAGETIVGTSFKRMRETYGDISQYRELFKYLIAFLIYNDGINTIIGLAVIYGAELGFATLELVLALLLVQFVGVPFTLMFGRLPDKTGAPRRHFYLAFVVFNAIALPLAGMIGARTLPESITGTPPPPYVTEGEFLGEGVYETAGFILTENWSTAVIGSQEQSGEGVISSLTMFLSPPAEANYTQADGSGNVDFAMNGQRFTLRYASQPDGGVLSVLVDGEQLIELDDDGNPVLDDDGNTIPVVIDTSNSVGQIRYGDTTTITVPEAGQYTITLTKQDENLVAVTNVEVLPPVRTSNLLIILGALLGMQAIGVLFALLTGRFFKPLADTLDTRRSILLSIIIYCIIAVWGFMLQATIEFWFLAWMVAVVQGGSQALSRSLYASLCPASKSGEFFGLFSIMSKFASIIGPLLFAGAVVLFGSSRPAILSLIILFAVGAFLLTRVNIEAGRRAAREEDEEIFGIAPA